MLNQVRNKFLPTDNPWSWWSYGLVIIPIAVATLISKVADPWLGDTGHFIPYFYMIALTALLADWRAGLLTTVLSLATWFYVFLYRTDHFQPDQARFYIQIGLITGTALMMIALAEWGRRQYHRALEETRLALAAQHDRQDSEERLKFALECGAIGTFNADLRANSITFGPVAQRIMGLTVATLSLDDLKRQVHPNDLVTLTDRLTLACDPAKRETFACEYRMILPDGLMAWIALRGRAIFEDIAKMPTAVSLIGVVHDITASKRSEDDLRRMSRHAHCNLWQATVTGMPGWDTPRALDPRNELLVHWGGTVQDIPAAAAVLDLEPQAGESWEEASYRSRLPEEIPRMYATMVHALQSGAASYEQEFRCRDRHGQIQWLFERPTILPLEPARWQLFGVTINITPVKRAEEEARESRAKLEAALASMTDAVFISDAEGRFLDFNDAFATYHRFKNKQQCADAFAQNPRILEMSLPSGEPLPSEQWPVARALRGETATNVQHSLRRVDTGESWVGSYSFAPIRNKNGEIVGSVVAARDITELQQAQDALRQSEDQFRRSMEDAPIPVIMYAEDGQILQLSRTWTELTGYNLEDMPTVDAWLSRTYGDELDAIWDYMRELFKGTRPFLNVEFPVRTADGQHRRWSFSTSSPGRLHDGRRFVVGMAIDITERKRSEEALAAAKISAERARTVAEEASTAKDHFLAVLSHELRTPLTPVVNTLAMLQEKGTLDAASREELEVIQRNIQLETRLIDDLLDVTRIARGKIELERKPQELREIIHRAVEVVAPDITARRLHFVMDAPESPYTVNADATRLQQVFWNLLRNAVKFTPYGGFVGIYCRKDTDGQVVVEVRDNGEGIEPDALQRIFNAFEQAERSIARQFGGLGLGLTISKALVEMHDGTIEALSEGKGKGATFRVRLPLVPAGAKTAAPVAAPAASVRPLRILLVEDHLDTARVLRKLLMLSGHTVQHAADVTSALELAGQHQFDLLLSDLGLPDRSGLELMRELRARGQNLPGIALSGYGQADDIRRSREVGFAMHLVKPANPRNLTEAIATVAAMPPLPEPSIP